MPQEGITMLVLTRTLSEIITLGDPLSTDLPMEIEVLEVRGDQVRIGVKAPRSVQVHRKEVWLQIQQERILAGLMLHDEVPSA